MSKYYYHMDTLLMIRQSTSLSLKLDSEGNTLPMQSMIPQHRLEIIELAYEDEESAESQWVHRVHTRLVVLFQTVLKVD